MDRARQVLSRWLIKIATQHGEASLPSWVVPWADSQLQVKLGRYELPSDLTKLSRPFDDAKLSIEILLSKVLDTLRRTFKDKFYMTATQQKGRLYYYFSADPPLETIILTLTDKNGAIYLGVGYVPHNPTSGADYSRALHRSVRIREPEMAGLELMRQLRSLLTRVR